MTDNTQAGDAWKAIEENPERLEANADDDADAVAVNRHNGKEETTTGGASLSDLTAKL